MAARSTLPVTITGTTTLKAHLHFHARQDPHDQSSNADGDALVVPLTIFDRVDFDRLVGFVLAFRPPTPSNETIKDGLSNALSYFPHLSARLRSGPPSLLLNNAGARLIEASVSVTLEEVLPLDPSVIDNVDDLFPPPHITQEELVHVQLSRFACGGLALGYAVNHHVGDGQSMSFFFDAWARLVRGQQLEQLPLHDRAAIVSARSRTPPLCLFDHDQIEFREIPPSSSSDSPVSQIVIHFSADFIAKLKEKVIDGDPSRRCSTFGCLLTHLWKKLTAVRGLHEEQLTKIRIAVNGRGRLQPPVPNEYFGNLVLWAFPTMKAGELLKQSYAQVFDVIHNAMVKIDDAYFKSFIDHGEVLKARGRGDAMIHPPQGSVFCPDVEADSWLSFDFHAIDFGCGPPSAFVIPPCQACEGLLIFVPSCVKKGSVDAFIGVMSEHVDRFKQSIWSTDPLHFCRGRL